MAQKKVHLYEIDLMRAFIMLGVLSVHTVTIYMSRLTDWTAPFLSVGAVHSSMHFTRESFMFITGLVLFITYYHRPFSTLKFWWKRLTLIAVPYVVWNIAYILYAHNYGHGFEAFLAKLGHSLKVGDQGYVYYVLVSIQFYIVFPILLYGLRKLERWHVHIFIGSFVFQLALTAFYHYWLPNIDYQHQWPYLIARITARYGTFVLTYQFWFVAGGILACHYERVKAYVKSHVALLRWLLVIGVLAMWAQYFFERFVLGYSDSRAELAETPLMAPYALIVTLNMWQLGMAWAERRTRPGWQPFSRFVMLASSTSFGIFLFQPFPLDLLWHIVPHLHTPSWVTYGSVPFAVLFVYFSGMLVAYLIGKVPYLAYCVGRKVKWPVRKPEAANTVSPSA
ncbi:acyltransferase [Alicyclobacillus herbarius]|uniref:acyltransferase n=1 Tax=Alicyclobacillus herbarius TaxID=122960 RepID=UPI000401B7AA|nr:acyltransferase [Alicyclobacillus herbarius]